MSVFITKSPSRWEGWIDPLLAGIAGLGVICGGFARYIASPRPHPLPYSDIDIYPLREDAYADLRRAVATVTGARGPEATNGRFWKFPYRGLDVQVIKPIEKARTLTVGDPEKVLGNFDFTVSRAALVGLGKVLVDADFDADEGALRLQIKNIHCPISSSLRVSKYVSKGYRIAPAEVLKLFQDWDGRDQAYRNEIVHGLTVLVPEAIRTQTTTNLVTAFYDMFGVD